MFDSDLGCGGALKMQQLPLGLAVLHLAVGPGLGRSAYPQREATTVRTVARVWGSVWGPERAAVALVAGSHNKISSLSAQLHWVRACTWWWLTWYWIERRGLPPVFFFAFRPLVWPRRPPVHPPIKLCIFCLFARIHKRAGRVYRPIYLNQCQLRRPL